MAHKGKKKKTIAGQPMPKKVQPVKASYPTWKDYLSKEMIPFAVLAIITVAIYFKTYQFEYVLDDVLVYTKNSFVTKGIAGISDLLAKESFTGYFGEQRDLVLGGRYRPLSLVTFALEYEFIGLNPSWSHVINLLLYILMLWLLYRFVQLLLLNKKNRPFYQSIAFWASALFAVHPTHVEVVANVKGRDEIMVGIFILLTLIYILKYVDLKKRSYLIKALGVAFLALLSKENAVVLLALAPMTIYFFRKYTIKESLKKTAVMVIPVGLFLLIRFVVVGYFLSSGQQITDVMNDPFVGMNLAQRYATVLYTLGIYFKLLFIPYPLTHDYYPYHIPIMNWGDWKVILSFVLYGLMTYWSIKSFSKRRLSSYFILFYLGSLFIVSNILFSVGTFMNERFLFLSSIAFCIWIVWWFQKLIRNNRPAWLDRSLFGFIPILMIFFWISFQRVPAWRDGFSLNSEAIKVSKNSARANSFMGTAWFNKYLKADRPDEQHVYLDEAKKYVDRAVEILPSYKTAQKMKAGIAAENYKLDADLTKMLETFKEVIMEHPGNAFVNEYLDYLHSTNRGYRELESFYLDIGYNKLYIQKNDFKWALHYLGLGLGISPNHPQLNYAMGAIYKKIGDRQAESYLSKARRLKPSIDQDFN